MHANFLHFLLRYLKSYRVSVSHSSYLIDKFVLNNNLNSEFIFICVN